MKRYGMAVAAMCLTILGPVLASPHLGEWPVRELLLVLLMWVALELYIGLRRPFQGHVPAHWIVRGSRLLWLVSAAYSWLDTSGAAIGYCRLYTEDRQRNHCRISP